MGRKWNFIFRCDSSVMSKLRLFANSRLHAECNSSPFRSQIKVVPHKINITDAKESIDIFGLGDGIHFRGRRGPECFFRSIASTLVDLYWFFCNKLLSHMYNKLYCTYLRFWLVVKWATGTSQKETPKIIRVQHQAISTKIEFKMNPDLKSTPSFCLELQRAFAWWD